MEEGNNHHEKEAKKLIVNDESNNHPEEEAKGLIVKKEGEINWIKYLSLLAEKLGVWKNYMSVSEAEFQCKMHIASNSRLKELLDWRKYMPIGYRFVPSDYELLKYYLLPKIHGATILPGLIQEVDVYQVHPAHLPGNKGEDFCYFFTPCNRKFQRHKRPSRTSKDERGHWKMTSKITTLSDIDGSELGRRNTLVYYEYHSSATSSSKKEIKTNWIMHEYILHNTLCNGSKALSISTDTHDKIVLCRIYERNKGTAEVSSQTERSGSLQIRDTDESSINNDEKGNYNKEKRLTILEPSNLIDQEKNTEPFLSTCKQASVVGEPRSSACNTGLLPLNKRQRLRHLPNLNLNLSFLDDSTSTCEDLEQGDESEPVTIMEEDRDFYTYCMLANTLKEKNETSHIYNLKENKSEQLLADTILEQNKSLVGHIHEQKNGELYDNRDTRIGHIERNQVTVNKLSRDSLSTLSSRPMLDCISDKFSPDENSSSMVREISLVDDPFHRYWQWRSQNSKPSGSNNSK